MQNNLFMEYIRIFNVVWVVCMIQYGPLNGLVKGLSSIFFQMRKVWVLMRGQANGNFSVDYDLRYWGEY